MCYKYMIFYSLKFEIAPFSEKNIFWQQFHIIFHDKNDHYLNLVLFESERNIELILIRKVNNFLISGNFI